MTSWQLPAAVTSSWRSATTASGSMTAAQRATLFHSTPVEAVGTYRLDGVLAPLPDLQPLVYGWLAVSSPWGTRVAFSVPEESKERRGESQRMQELVLERRRERLLLPARVAYSRRTDVGVAGDGAVKCSLLLAVSSVRDGGRFAPCISDTVEECELQGTKFWKLPMLSPHCWVGSADTYSTKSTPSIPSPLSVTILQSLPLESQV